MTQVRYTVTHEWLRVDGDGTATVGITPHAAESLGELVYVELPEVGKEFAQGAEVAVVESVKAASGVLMPVDGTIVEVNATMADDPAKVTADPAAGGWLFRIKPARPDQVAGMLDQGAYETLMKDAK
jgi:glycine cleavage system H protein